MPITQFGVLAREADFATVTIESWQIVKPCEPIDGKSQRSPTDGTATGFGGDC